MTTPETLTFYYGLTYNVIHQQIDGLTHADSLLQLPFRGNCLNWVLGHIVFSRGSVLTLLGENAPWTTEESDRYIRNSEPVTNEKDALPLEQLLNALEESQARILSRLREVSAEKLATVNDDETVAERIAFLQWHETYHVGQLEPLRQLAGKNDKVI